jgi:hypothetical protein
MKSKYNKNVDNLLIVCVCANIVHVYKVCRYVQLSYSMMKACIHIMYLCTLYTYLSH